MKIAIYIDNRNISSVDCTDLSKGNPGIGGTEYCILLLAQMIKCYHKEIEVILLVEKKGCLPKVDEILLVNGLNDVSKIAKKADILVISSRRDGNPLPQTFFNQLDENKVKTVLWGHNYYYSDYCNRIANCNAIRANVFVGRQQYDRYVDHKIILKSTYIYNMYPMEKKQKRKFENQHTVTYIGSLVPEKGFQVLAAAWKKIIAEVPDAQLNVIGSGKLYSRNSKLGKYKIAEEHFENQFMRCLIDDAGKILPSVNFLGVMGAEKDNVILETGVGVVNPTGRTETFGISALDFESMGVPVVTIAKGGFLDTVIDHKTGILSRNVSGIADAIITLLKNSNMNKHYGHAGIKLAENFVPSLIIEEWINLFFKILNDEKLQYKKPEDFMASNLKWLRVINHNFKSIIKISDGISVIGVESLVKAILRRLGH